MWHQSISIVVLSAVFVFFVVFLFLFLSCFVIGVCTLMFTVLVCYCCKFNILQTIWRCQLRKGIITVLVGLYGKYCAQFRKDLARSVFTKLWANFAVKTSPNSYYSISKSLLNSSYRLDIKYVYMRYSRIRSPSILTS